MNMNEITMWRTNGTKINCTSSLQVNISWVLLSLRNGQALHIAWRLKREGRSQPNKNWFAKWLGIHKVLLADKTLLVSYSSLSLHSPHDALCSIANALQVLVPLLYREHCITHPGRVETRRKRHLYITRGADNLDARKQIREREQSLRYQVIACALPWQVSLLVTCAHNLN